MADFVSNCCTTGSKRPIRAIMGSLKRKEGPNGASASKSARPAADTRPSKRAKASESTKEKEKGRDDGKKGEKSPAKPATATVVTKLREEEPLFPRGGGSVLTPLEQKQISIQAKKDVLFEEESAAKKGGDKAARKKKRKSRADEADTKSAKDEDAVKVESLNFKVGRTGPS